MIEKVQFRNFKAYRSLDLELEPFTVLVGPNASGKTTLLEGLRLLSTHAAPLLKKSSQGKWLPPELQSFGTTHAIDLTFQGLWIGAQGYVRIRGAGAAAEGAIPPVSIEWKSSRFTIPHTQGGIAYESAAKLARELGGALAATSILRFEPRALAEASYSDAPVPEVASDGSGLASTLAYLKLSHEDLFSEIELALKRIVPSVRRIRIERAAVEQNNLRTIALDEQKTQVSERRILWGNRIALDMQGAKEVPADSAGEGTLMVLGLLTVLMGSQRPRLVLLDDIELSLHPTAQGKLIEVLRAIQKNDPGLQIVATSHSPFILNYLKPEEVRMTFLAENGFARCEKLTAHPDFEKWKDLMSPGEFWSTVGESWMEKVPASPSHE